MKGAFEAWDSHRINNGSDVSFDDSTYSERASEPTTQEAGAFVFVRKAGGSAFSRSILDTATGIVYARITIGFDDNPQVYLQLTKHEIGHNFNLANCQQACSQDGSSIMGMTQPHFDITHCDDAAVKRLYSRPGCIQVTLNTSPIINYKRPELTQATALPECIAE